MYSSNTSIYYVCSICQSFHGQSLGKMVEKVNERNGNVNNLFKAQSGPPVSEKCPECGSAMHVAYQPMPHSLLSIDSSQTDCRSDVVWQNPCSSFRGKDSRTSREQRRQVWYCCAHEGYAHGSQRGEFGYFPVVPARH